MRLKKAAALNDTIGGGLRYALPDDVEDLVGRIRASVLLHQVSGRWTVPGLGSIVHAWC